MLCKEEFKGEYGICSPDVTADPPRDAEERVEADDAVEAIGCHVMPRCSGSECESVECRYWRYGGPSHKAPHLYDGLMARSVMQPLYAF